MGCEAGKWIVLAIVQWRIFLLDVSCVDSWLNVDLCQGNGLLGWELDCTGCCSVTDILAGRVTKHSVLIPDFFCLYVSLRQVMRLELAEYRVLRHAFLLPCRTPEQLNNGLSP